MVRQVPEFFQNLTLRPLEYVEFVIGLLTFLSGIWLTSPLFHAAGPSASIVASLSGMISIAVVLGFVQVVVSGLLIYALLRMRWPSRKSVRAKALLFLVCLFMFYGISGFLLSGLVNIRWMSTISLAVITGICRVAIVKNE